MPLFALLMLLAAALCHASWNYVAKGTKNDLALQLWTTIVPAVVYLPLAAIVLLAGGRFEPAGLAFIAVSSIFHITYFWMLTAGYRAGDLSLVYPLARGTGPLLAVAGAIILYGERPGALALAGTALIVGGILFMSWSSELRSRDGAGVAVAFALATGACTAAYTLWDKQGVERMSPVLYGYGLELCRVAFLSPAVFSRAEGRARMGEAWRTQRRAVFAIGILSPAAYMLVLGALSIADVSYVAPGREISILIGALLGLRLLGESHPLRRMAGASAIVLGIVALALG